MSNQFRLHPWHGVSAGENAPDVVNVYVEIVPSDTVKYELDKDSGILKIDRPQSYSNVLPSIYGFIPQTYCGKGIAKFATDMSGKTVEKGDGDPLDICVLSEHRINHADILLKARPIGGFRLIDKGEADDKIIAVLVGDAMYNKYNDLSELPQEAVLRLKHYFLTYKLKPGDEDSNVIELAAKYGREEAQKVINLSREDYKNEIS